jgi:hypothetical protein
MVINMRFLGINWSKNKKTAESKGFIADLEVFNNKHIDEMKKVKKLIAGLEQHVKKVALTDNDIRMLSDCMGIIENATNYYDGAKKLMDEDARFINAAKNEEYEIVRNLLSDITGPGIIVDGRNINIAMGNILAATKDNASALNSYAPLNKNIEAYIEKLNGLNFNLDKIIQKEISVV